MDFIAVNPIIVVPTFAIELIVRSAVNPLTCIPFASVVPTIAVGAPIALTVDCLVVEIVIAIYLFPIVCAVVPGFRTPI